MPHFGSRVIGDKAFEKELTHQRSGAGHFGPRVLGPPPTDRPRDSDAPEPPEPPESKKKAPDAEGVAVAEIITSLEANELLVEPLYEQELARPSGPREDALRVFQRYFPAGSDTAKEIKELLADLRKRRPKPEKKK